MDTHNKNDKQENSLQKDTKVMHQIPLQDSPKDTYTLESNDYQGIGKKRFGRLLGDSDGQDTNQNSDNNKRFIDIVYDKIHEVIGGSNPNQFFLLTLPGQALSAQDFAYDYKNNAPKGPTVEANESRLANKLFDPCRITGGDNGLTLPYQYRSALDALSPKLNGKLANAKNELRRLLLSEYPYDFGDEVQKSYTLQEVFFRLYDDWVEAMQKWSELQNKQKKELRQKYPNNTQEDNVKYNDAYLEWYETVAESYLNAINEKMSKILSVFSPNDMKILEGILDSGSGAELQQARQTLINTEKITPDGGYVYPVKFNPTNWFELLTTSFTPIDLLESPAAIATKMQSLSSRRLKLAAQINQLTALIPSTKEIQDAKKKVEDSQKTLNEARKGLNAAYSGIFDVALDIAAVIKPDNEDIKKVLNKLEKNVDDKDKQESAIQAIIDKLKGENNQVCKAQQNLLDASRQLTDSLAKSIQEKNLKQLESALIPLKAQLEEIDSQTQALQGKMQIAHNTQADDSNSQNDTTPPGVPEGYTQILIQESMSTMENATEQKASSEQSTSGAGFWFFGGNHQNTTASDSFKNVTDDKAATIEIGMNIAKVGIEREWFNPGVFALTKDMFNVTTLKIAPNPETPYTEINDGRLEAMSSCIFPCYPVAMVIARDISIKISGKKGDMESFAESTESHAATGGGFLFFNGSKSSSNSSSDSAVCSSATDNTITLKFSTPQIIGYYLEVTSADKSTPIDSISQDEDRAGFVTIEQFVASYRKILEEIKKQK